MASIQLHAEIVQRNGKSVVVLPYEEFVALQEVLADYEDLVDLRTAKDAEHDAPSIPISEVQREFGT